MTRAMRWFLVGCALACVLAGMLLLMRPAMMPAPAWIVVIAGSLLAGLTTASLVGDRPGRDLTQEDPERARPAHLEEVDDIREVTEERRRELIRGASKQLTDFRYRYSVRMHHTDVGEHRCFNADVNRVRLGFIPAIITDNTNDRQGYGYVAFVYDGHRWRGPGLPCPAGQMEAVRHASRCVSPLATEEETTFEESYY